MHICVYTSIYTIAYQYDLWLHLPNLNLVTWRYRLVSSLQKLQNPSIGASKSFQSLLPRIQFALGPVRWPFQHLDLGIWGREWGVMKEGVFFFVALQINILHLAFFHFFPDGPSSGNHHWMIFVQPFLNHWTKITFLGYWGFVPIFSHQIKLGLFTQLDQGPFQLIDLLTSGCQGPSHPPTQPPQGSLRHWTMLRPLLPTVWGIIRFLLTPLLYWAPFPWPFLSASQFQVLNYLFGSCTSHAIWAWASVHLLLLKALVNINMTHVSQCI